MSGERKMIDILNGLVLIQIEIYNNEEIIFTEQSGRKFRMFHAQDCCETVSIDDVIGDIQDLIGTPILMAEEVSSQDIPGKDNGDESHTWTFYKFRTIKGSVDIRWYGSSSGYYSESVDFVEIANLQ